MRKSTSLEPKVDIGLATLEEIWFSVFASKGGKAKAPLVESGPAREMRQMPLYDLGGDLVDAVYFVALIEHRRKTCGTPFVMNDHDGPQNGGSAPLIVFAIGDY